MRRVVSLVVWWALLTVLWTLLVGTTRETETIAGVAAAGLTAAAVQVLRSHELVSLRADVPWLVRAWRLPLQIVYDFWLVAWLLVRGRRVEGELVEIPFQAGGSRPRERWRRAWVTTVGTMSPNAIVVDVDRERNVAVLHVLDRERWTGRSPL